MTAAPFSTAQFFGYKPDEIIKFVMKNIPGLDKKIEKAMAAGYTTEQILEFLKGQTETKQARKQVEEDFNRPFTDEQGRLTEAQRQRRGEKKARQQSFLSQTLDPRRVGSSAIGAGVGFATGGPIGAVGGAVAGAETFDDVLRKYEEHKAAGGTMGLKDFLASLAKGVAKGVGVTGIARSAADMLGMIQEETPQQAPTGEPTEPEPQAPTQVQEPEVEEKEEITISPTEAKSSYEVIQKSGVGNILDRVTEDLEPIDAMKLTRNMFGAQTVKDIERERGKPFEKVFEEYKQYKATQQPQAKVQEQPEEETKETLKGQDVPQVTFKQVEDPRGFSFNDLIVGGTEKAKPIKGRVQPFESAMKSSNLSAATFDPDSGKMRILFRAKEGGKGGNVYEYENMDLETFEKMTGGKAKPVTEGSNKFGVWFNTKNPSIGATFSKFIKKNPEQFPYKKVEPEGYSLEEKQIVQADRAHLASELFEPFASKRKEGRQRARAQGLKDLVPALKSMDDDFLFDVVAYLEDKLKNKLKTEPKVKRLAKEFEKEFQR